MDVVIDGKLYKATKHSIIAILGSKDKFNISNMADEATRYGSFPCETTQEEAEKMLVETLDEQMLLLKDIQKDIVKLNIDVVENSAKLIGENEKLKKEIADAHIIFEKHLSDKTAMDWTACHVADDMLLWVRKNNGT